MTRMTTVIVIMIMAFLTCAYADDTDMRGIKIVEAGNAYGGVKYEYNKNYAVIIGIDRYVSWPKLKSAVKDARAIEEILIDDFSFKRENVFTLYDEEATKDSILELFIRLRTLPADASLVLYYSGHGWLDQKTNDGYWIPVGTEVSKSWKGISITDLMKNYLQPLPVKHLSIFVDACFSGALLSTRGIENSPFHAKKFTRRSRMALTSGNIEPVPDEVAKGHSLFNLKLQQYLKGNLPGANKEFFTMSDIYTVIGPEISRFSPNQQEPMLARLNDPQDEKGEFVFYRRPNGTIFLPYGDHLEESIEYNALRRKKPADYNSVDDLLEMEKRDFEISVLSKTADLRNLKCVAFVGDDQYIIVTESAYFLKNLTGKTLYYQEFPFSVKVCAVEKKAKKLVISNKNRIYIYSIGDNQVWSVVAQKNSIAELSLSQKNMLAVAYDNGDLEIIDVNQSLQVKYLEDWHDSTICTVRFNPAGDILCSVGEDKVFRFFDMKKQKEIKSYKESSTNISGITLSDDAALFAINAKTIEIDLYSNRRKDLRYIIIRNFSSGSELMKIDFRKDVSSYAFHPNKRYLSIFSDNQFILFDVATGKEAVIYRMPEAIDNISFSDDGSKAILSSRNQVNILSL